MREQYMRTGKVRYFNMYNENNLSFPVLAHRYSKMIFGFCTLMLLFTGISPRLLCVRPEIVGGGSKVVSSSASCQRFDRSARSVGGQQGWSFVLKTRHLLSGYRILEQYSL